MAEKKAAHVAKVEPKAEAKSEEPKQPEAKKPAHKPLYNVMVNGGSVHDASVMDLSELADVAKGVLLKSNEVTLRVIALIEPGAMAASRRDGIKLPPARGGY